MAIDRAYAPAKWALRQATVHWRGSQVLEEAEADVVGREHAVEDLLAMRKLRPMPSASAVRNAKMRCYARR